jgi:hypothetical protein
MKKSIIFLIIMLLASQAAFAENIKLTASDGQSSDYFGYAVSISGNFAIVGAYAEDDKGTDAGAAYIFEKTPTGWIQKQKLLADDGAASDYFGYAVSISGNFAIVGAYREDDKGSDAGAAYIFENSTSGWIQKQKLLASDGGGSDHFGSAVSISGNTAIVGSRYDDDKGTDTGAVYIFKKNGSNWTQEDKLYSSDPANSDNFGHAVSISEDKAIVGAYNKNNKTGAAYIFEHTSSGWQEKKILLASNAANSDHFGRSVSISDNIAIVGAYQKNSSKGVAYIYEFTNNDWQETQLVASDAQNDDHFGYAVSIYGNTAIVGAYQEDDKAGNAGAAYLYERTSTGWQEKTKLVAADGQSFDYFGVGVSISGDNFIIGAHGEDHRGSSAGAAYIFSTNIKYNSISGYVMDSSNRPVVNATITPSHAQQPTKTDANGYFIINNLYYNWSGNLSVSKDNYQFNPSSLTFNAVTQDINNQFFFIDAFTISGFITTPLDQPISGVRLTFTNNGGTAVTNSQGYYSHKILKNWSGEVFCEGRGFMYTPLRAFYKNMTDNLFDQNFIGHRFTISGYCLDDNQQPLKDVYIKAMPGNILIQADRSGYFEYDFDYEWTGSLTPIKSGVDFSPVARSYTGLYENKVEQNFDASPREYAVQGSILDQDNQALSGVQLCFDTQCVETENGIYAAVLPFQWSGSVCPKKNGYLFAPSCIQYTNLTTDETHNYSATIHQYIVSGIIIDSDTKLPLEHVQVNVGSETKLSDASGRFQWQGPYGSQITVQPEKIGYVFEPERHEISLLNKDQTNLNFSASKIPLTISGTVKFNGTEQEPVTDNVVIKCSGIGLTSTDISGEYSCSVPHGWSGEIEIFMENHTFLPPLQAFVSVTNNLVQNFTAYPSTSQQVYSSLLANCLHPNISHDGGVTNIKVWHTPESMSWTAEAEYSWITLNQSDNQVSVTVGPNTQYLPRTAIVIIKASGATNSPQFIEIYQDALPQAIVGPNWENIFDPTQFQNVQMMTAVVLDDQGNALTHENQILAAFVGDEIRGVARPMETSQGSRFFLQIWSHDLSESAVSFKLYDGNNDRINVNIKYPITFKANEQLGSINDPHILSVSDYFVRVELNKYWNWISINAKSADMSVNTVLKSIDGKGIRIIGQQGFEEYDFNSHTWFGTLKQIDPLRMYKLKTNSSAYLEHSGNAMDLSTNPIPLTTGWNWIGYLPSESLPLNTALESISDNGLMICGQKGFAMYDSQVGWIGSLSRLESNRAYMLKMAVEDSLVYPSQPNTPRARTRRLRTSNNQTPVNGWTLDASLFEHQGAVIIEVKQNQRTTGKTGDGLAAFAGTECRGVATPVNTPHGIRFFLQVWSSTPNETLSLKYYIAAQDKFYTISETIPFTPDMVLGSITEPKAVSLTTETDLDDPLLQELISLQTTLRHTSKKLANTQQALTRSTESLIEAHQSIETLEASLMACKINQTQIFGYTTDLEPGWHLISGINKDVVPETDPPDCIEAMYIFEQGQYTNVDLLPAHKGVWLKVSEACRVSIE